MNSRPSRSQLRRRARQAHRDGYQPMMMINSEDFPEPALAVIARWIWRYRSELAPSSSPQRPHSPR
jgi:hypothetical protein